MPRQEALSDFVSANGLPAERAIMGYRRGDFLAGATAVGLAAAVPRAALAASEVTLPFANGTRPLVAFPQKRPLMMLSPRPPLLETPFSVFNESILTPNDAFYVRWHLAGIPTVVDGATHRIRVHGLVKRELSLSVDDLRRNFERVEIVAVNQCSGNSRGFFDPRVPGGEWGNGAMGNARWAGVRLADVLAKAGLKEGVREIRFSGLDRPVLPATPPFVKALSIDDILDDGHMMIAYEMNGAPLPLLNGYPVRIVVPGWYATYWMKMLSDIEAIDGVDDNFWMKTAYRIPQTPGNTVAPTDTGYKTVPINRLTVRCSSPAWRTAARSVPAGKRFAGSPSTAEAGSRRCSSRTTAVRRGKRRNWAVTTATTRSVRGRAPSSRNAASSTCWRAARLPSAAKRRRPSRCGTPAATFATSSRPTR